VKPIIDDGEVACIGRILSAEENTWSAIEQKTFDDLIENIEEKGYVSRAYTGNLAVRRTVFEELCGFDEDIIWNADTDLSIRLIKAGYRIKYVPEAKVRHFHRTSLARIFKRKFQQGYWANSIYRKNNGEPKEYGRMIWEMKKTITFLTLSLASLVASLHQPFRIPAYIASAILFFLSAYEFTCPTTMIYITKKRTLKQKIYMLTYFFGWRIGLISSLIK